MSKLYNYTGQDTFFCTLKLGIAFLQSLVASGTTTNLMSTRGCITFVSKDLAELDMWLCMDFLYDANVPS